MAKIGEKELKEQIKTRNFSGAYLIYGEEDYLKEYYFGELKNKNVDKAFENFNYHSYNGKNASLEDILSDAEMLPMMGGCNFVSVCDYPTDKLANELNDIKEFLTDIPESTILVFRYQSMNFDTKDNDKLKAVEAAFTKYGSTVVLNKRSESELIKLLVSGFKKRNAVISADTARYLISVSGSDMKTLINETDKIASYAKGGEVTKKMIDQLAVKSLQAQVYDLSKAVVKGNYDKAYSVLDTLFVLKEKPDRVLSTLSNCYVDMYRVKCAKMADMPIKDVAVYYDYKGKEWLLDNAARNGYGLSVAQLRKSLDVLMEADNNIKSTAADNKLILEETMVKLLLISKEVKYD